jgi:RNA polymerase sigma-70 factor (ECF subfamily)
MEELTDKQRTALTAIMEGFPLEEAARRLGTNRNALYKMLHDARLRLKKRLEKEGLTPSEVLAVFEKVRSKRSAGHYYPFVEGIY